MTEVSRATVDDERALEDVLDTIGDEGARRILAAINSDPRPAKELAAETGLSLPTVYRRLDRLEEHDLVTERTAVAADGNHRSVYASNFDSTVIALQDDGYRVRIRHRDDPSDRFSLLWDELATD